MFVSNINVYDEIIMVISEIKPKSPRNQKSAKQNKIVPGGGG